MPARIFSYQERLGPIGGAVKKTVLVLLLSPTVFLSLAGKQVREPDPPKFILDAYRAARR